LEILVQPILERAVRRGAALDVSRIEPYGRALNFNPKSTLSSDGSSALFWASDEIPVIVARIGCDDIFSVAENPNQDWQKWADTNAEVLIGIASNLFRAGSYKNDHGMRVIDIRRDKLDAKKGLFRSVPDIHPRWGR
jgi:hypothetical protein